MSERQPQAVVFAMMYQGHGGGGDLELDLVDGNSLSYPVRIRHALYSLRIVFSVSLFFLLFVY